MGTDAPCELLCTEAEVFEIAYGDLSGRDYWAAWLSPPDEDDRTLARLLATHATAERLSENREFIAALIEGGESNFAQEVAETSNSIDRDLRDALKAFPAGTARDRIAQIAASPKTSHCLPSSLREFLAQDAPRASAGAQGHHGRRPRAKGGRPGAADWSALEEALCREIETVGLPERGGEPGWQTTADVIRWMEPKCGEYEPGKTALKENVSAMLGRARARLAGN